MRLYDHSLSQTHIADDRDGKYSEALTPIAAYDFNEGSGVTANNSVGSNDGIIEGATWAINGKYGSALNFDGTDDQVVVPDSEALDLTGTFTLEAWVRPNQVGVWDPIVTKADGENRVGYRLLAAGGALFHSEYGAPSGIAETEVSSSTIAGSEQLPAESWSHVALTSDGMDLRLYVNGEEIATAAASGAATTNSDLAIGASDVPGEGASVLDTIFMQWHASNEGLDCDMEGGQPPIAFHVRRVAGGAEFIYMSFSGGELGEESCKAVQSPAFYGLAPLERNQWYDFVLHTKWTTEEGDPGNSVSEVWLDGEQVLGNESQSVTRPNLYWHGTPSMRNPITNMQFGIYRHVSGSQPTSRLYIDAVRRGSSYSEVAPGQ